ncbi:MAG: hypothetical protein NVSMB62_08140 [Acidobacteriaceae bacterium]
MTLFHPVLHPLFESLGYAAGYAVFRRTRARRGDLLSEERRWIVIAAAAVGALLGSRVLGLLEQAPARGLRWQDFLLPGGKTIVGGLLGGWLAVELVKLAIGVRSRTGDLFAVPLCVGIAIGRVGCFLAGLADDTYGIFQGCGERDAPDDVPVAGGDRANARCGGTQRDGARCRADLGWRADDSSGVLCRARCGEA